LGRLSKDKKMKITTKQFQILTDINLVWDFLVETYDWKKDSGRPAPFFEHAIKASWMDSSYSFLDRIWFDGDKVIAFVYYEAPVTDIYFNVRKGYEFLADELIDYAVTKMPSFGNNQQLILFDGQQFLKDAAAKRGFNQVYECTDMIFDFKNELNYALPKGYHFVESEDIDICKLSKLCWYGFDHGDKGDFININKYDDSLDWTPAKSHKDCLSDWNAPLPHSTHQYDIVIADKNEEYVCFSGMWWIPENKLAYMEPLCTSPEHRKKGLAAAALTKHYHRMKALGASHMTGGENLFYKKIGYEDGYHLTFWKMN